MFTGLIEDIGTVSGLSGSDPVRITIKTNIDVMESKIGDSVAIDGCCLTIVERAQDKMTFQAASESIRLTTLKQLNIGSKVHLERAMKLSDRLDGHIVTGHIDGRGVVTVKQQSAGTLILGIKVSDDFGKYIVHKGSISLAGVSLTVNKVEKDVVYVGLIPHTLKQTVLEQYQIGASINVEADILGRYVYKLLDRASGSHSDSSKSGTSTRLNEAFLSENGFL